MKNKEYNKSYDIALPTKEEIQAIKNGDIKLLNKYYLLNYDLIKACAIRYCARVLEKNRDIAQDIVQEVYLAMREKSFKMSTNVEIVRSIYDVACRVRQGRTQKDYDKYRLGRMDICCSLDDIELINNKKGAKTTLGETIPTYDLYFQEDVPNYTDKIFKYCAKMLAPRQKEALKYFYYTDMTAREIGSIMGININGAQSLKTTSIYKLRKNKDKILLYLKKIGYERNYS
ncbi:MAG: sigma-70 family RNA polymerase sigma factor [Clostridia bacterium]|nr:sigma-70 family RNA polymerase sigma factor [Clostridia bacterium]